MKYLKFTPYVTAQNASRNRREMAAASEYGFDVYCYSSDRTPPTNTAGQPFTMVCDETPVVSYAISKPRRIMQILCNKLRHMRRLRSLNMDVISCHDIDSLAVAYLAYSLCPRGKRPKLIYDSHEFELMRKPRGRFNTAFLTAEEGFLMRRCSFSIMVNDGIADGVQKIHKLAQRPVVVRSTPEYWEIDKAVSESMHGQFCEALHVPEDTFIVIYTGYLMEFRGLEEILGALALKKDICAVWVGDAPNAQYEQRLMDMASSLGVSARLLRYPAQPHAELWKYISGADVSAVMNDEKNRNYRYALPNKFFEAIQSITPVICSNTPEMARIVKQYGIGLLTSAGSSEALASAISELQHSRALYDSFKQNLIPAKNELCWEKEKQHLFDAYKTYL